MISLVISTVSVAMSAGALTLAILDHRRFFRPAGRTPRAADWCNLERDLVKGRSHG